MQYSKNIKTYIKENLINTKGYPNSAVLRRDWFKDSEEYKQILEETDWAGDLPIKDRILIIYNDIQDFNKCEFCGGNIKFKNILKPSRFCSKKCSCASTQDIRRSSELENYQKLKSDKTVHPLKETLEYLNSKLLKAGNYERESIYDGFYYSVLYYNKIENISFAAKVYCLINDIQELPICQCGQQITELVDMKIGFRTFCSNSCQSKYNSEKRQETYQNKTGFPHPHKNPEVIKSMKENMLEKYGELHYMKLDEYKDKVANTKMEKYGDPGYNNYEQIKKTCLERYGQECIMSTTYFKETSKQTLKEKYGTDYINVFREKAKKTCLERYGVENHMQSGLFGNGYKWYEYELPSGKIIKYQGYENRYIPILIRKYGEENVCFEKSKIPKIKYTFKNKTHYYFPDFYVPSKNLIIEIKSVYTLNSQKHRNEAKFKAVIEKGFNFKLKVYR